MHLNQHRDTDLRSIEAGIVEIRESLIMQKRKGLDPNLDVKDKYIFSAACNEPIEHLWYTASYRRLHGGLLAVNADGLDDQG